MNQNQKSMHYKMKPFTISHITIYFTYMIHSLKILVLSVELFYYLLRNIENGPNNNYSAVIILNTIRLTLTNKLI